MNMKTSTRIAGIIFVALSLIEVTFIALGVETFHPWLKPLLIPSLAAAALFALLPEHKGRQTTLLACALAFHTLGDILLLLDYLGFIWFALGLGFFLIGHFFMLAVILYKMGGLQGWKEILCWCLPVALAFPAVSFFDAVGAMRYVLIAYAVTLLFIIASGVLWVLRGRREGWRIITGGVLFLISDAIVGLNAFNGLDFPLRHATTMGTYLAADWLLVSGIVLHLLRREGAERCEKTGLPLD